MAKNTRLIQSVVVSSFAPGTSVVMIKSRPVRKLQFQNRSSETIAATSETESIISFF